MKKLTHKVLIGLTTLSSGLVLFHFISMKVSSRITGDEDYKSFKNELLTICFILTCLMATVFGVSLYTSLASPWTKLQQHYANDTPVEYQDGKYKLVLNTRENEKQKHIYDVKLSLYNDGLYLSRPINHFFNRSETTLFFEDQVFIPWNAIKECKKLHFDNIDKMQMYINKSNILLEISLWEFFKPLCIENGVPVKE